MVQSVLPIKIGALVVEKENSDEKNLLEKGLQKKKGKEKQTFLKKFTKNKEKRKEKKN